MDSKLNNFLFELRVGVEVLGFIGLVFVVLKLLEIIAWDWIWVVSPLTTGLAVSMLMAIILIGREIARGMSDKW